MLRIGLSSRQRWAPTGDEEDALAARRPTLFRPNSPWALGEHLDLWRFVKPYLGQGFLELEILIAAQAPLHRTPSKVRKPTFPQRDSSLCGQF